ncbi:MAG: homoaconitate hydratase [Calditerrivibrio sp.]|nr:homoaconitate hydratase [Calditerrivibrio sp.]
MRKIFLDDTTLRDGEQTPGIVMAKKDKIKIAKMLDRIGVDEIEAGFPASSRYALDTFYDIKSLNLKAKLIAWNRATVDDVKKSIEAGADRVEISIPISDLHIRKKLNKDRDWVLYQIQKVVEFCKEKGLYVSVGGEDSSRADVYFLLQFVKHIEKCGADRFRFCDTVGVLDPFKVFELVTQIKSITKLPIEIHAHNDFGMATANAVAAIEAGADYVNTTFLGIGERAGNTPLEEILIWLQYKGGFDLQYDISSLKSIAKDISDLLKIKIAFNKPIVGRNAFCHESGMHVDGVLKSPDNYEPFPPEVIGVERKISFGLSSGRSGLIYFLKKLGFGIEKDSVSVKILEIFKRIVLLKKILRPMY